MKFVHISDFHLTAPGEPLCGLDPHERVARVLEDIARWHGDADFCVITGDLTDRGEPQAYAWLADRLAGFPLETFVMTGNHDDREALCAAFPDAPRDENGFLQHAHVTDGGTFLFLDTLKEEPVSAGEYCARRQEWLAARLAEAKDRPVWIFMHHPPFDIGIPYMDRIKLEEPEAFANVIAGHDVRHIFFGHVHRPVYVNWRGIPCTALPGTAHQVPLVRESVGAAYSLEPAMYAVVLAEADRTVVHFDAPLDRAAPDIS